MPHPLAFPSALDTARRRSSTVSTSLKTARSVYAIQRAGCQAVQCSFHAASGCALWMASAPHHGAVRGARRCLCWGCWPWGALTPCPALGAFCPHWVSQGFQFLIPFHSHRWALLVPAAGSSGRVAPARLEHAAVPLLGDRG